MESGDRRPEPLGFPTSMRQGGEEASVKAPTVRRPGVRFWEPGGEGLPGSGSDPLCLMLLQWGQS